MPPRKGVRVIATESPLIHDGSQTTLSTANDARRSSITGTTLNGPNGSGQFLAVILSTVTDRTVTLATTTSSTGAPIYGILQNTPPAGSAADVGIFGLTKVVAGTTGFARGAQLTLAGTSGLAGTLIGFTTGLLQAAVGVALETPSTPFSVITAALYAYGRGGQWAST